MAFPAELAARCIFCQRPASNALSVAHVVSQSLIEEAPTLPRGAECERCNGILSKVERTFINDYLGSVTRILEVRKTKKGKPPAAHWRTASMRAVDGHDGRRTLQIFVKGKPSVDVPESVDLQLPDEKPIVMSRFVCKCALEVLRFFERPEVFDSRLDAARNLACHPRRGMFIPYAWRAPAGDPLGFRLLETEDPPEQALFPVPPILVSVPGLVFLTTLVPMPTARPFVETAAAAGWSVRSSDRRPKRQVWRLTFRSGPGTSSPP